MQDPPATGASQGGGDQDRQRPQVQEPAEVAMDFEGPGIVEEAQAHEVDLQKDPHDEGQGQSGVCESRCADHWDPPFLAGASFDVAERGICQRRELVDRQGLVTDADVDAHLSLDRPEITGG